MEIEQKHRDYILRAFQKLNSKNDLLALLNYAKPLIYSEKATPFELKQLTYFANPKVSLRRYTKFKIRKKSGATRIIHAPVRGLKSLQKVLNLIFHSVFEANKAATGFVHGKSIVDNAKLHTESYYVYNIDLKDFFHSIDQARVWKCLQNRPLNLGSNQSKNAKKFNTLSGTNPIEFGNQRKYEVVNIISALCCTRMVVERLDSKGELKEFVKNVLPQGAPTSPVITNIVCQKLDFLLSGVAKRFGLRYSRYADDITFSSLHNVYQNDGDFIKELNRIIIDQGFQIKESKTRLQKRGYRQEVTGLLVNEKVNVQQRYIKQLRMWLYYWERYGYEKAEIFFLNQYFNDKGHVKKGEPNMANVIAGKLEYLKMVKGVQSNTFLKLKHRFNVLFEKLNEQVNYDGVLKEDITESYQNKISDSEEKKLGSVKHKPKDVADFMALFNKREGLKYLTHDFDEGKIFDIQSFLINTNKVFKENANTFVKYTIPQTLWSIIDQFAFQKAPKWTSADNETILTGWSTQDWINWSIKNKLHPIRNENFNRVISSFRLLTRIESPNLESRIQNLVNKVFTGSSDFSIIQESLFKADFYTHTPSFERAVSAILELMKLRGQHKNIRISYERTSDGDYFVRKLIFDQIGSFPTRELDVLVSDWNSDKGGMGGIRDNLYGFCHWSVETKIEDRSVRVNILKEESTPAVEFLDGLTINGFKHILTFYYR